MKIVTKNKRATFDHEIIDTLDVGIVLQWHEVKSVRTQGCSLQDAIVTISGAEAWIVNMNIPLYKKAAPVTLPTYQPKARRKLLLTKLQLTKLWSKTQKSWLVIIPTQLRESKHHKFKLTIALAKRKKNIQKKQALKEKETKKMMDKEAKNFRTR